MLVFRLCRLNAVSWRLFRNRLSFLILFSIGRNSVRWVFFILLRSAIVWISTLMNCLIIWYAIVKLALFCFISNS